MLTVLDKANKLDQRTPNHGYLQSYSPILFELIVLDMREVACFNRLISIVLVG